MVQIIFRLSNLVTLDPLCTVFLRHSHFYSVLVDALNDSSIALERSCADCDRFSDFEFLIFSGKTWLDECLRLLPSVVVDIFGNNKAVV